MVLRPHPNGEWQFRSECIRLKMLLREACAPSSKGAPPLLAENPFTLPIPPRAGGRVVGYSAGHARRTVPYI